METYKKDYYRSFLIEILEDIFELKSDNNWIEYDNENLKNLVKINELKRKYEHSAVR